MGINYFNGFDIGPGALYFRVLATGGKPKQIIRKPYNKTKVTAQKYYNIWAYVTLNKTRLIIVIFFIS